MDVNIPRRNRKPRVRRLVCAVAASVLVGCSMRFHEKYYVGIYDKGATKPGKKGTYDKPVQFYRFDLAGFSSYFCDTKYESGWYDAEAVERLFGEIDEPGQTSKPKPPAAANGEVSSIPVLSSTGTCNDSSGNTIAMTDVLIEPRVGNLQFADAWSARTGSMLPYRNLSNCTVRVAFDSHWQISSMQITNHCDAGAASVGDVVPQQYCDVTPDQSNSDVSIPNAMQLIVRGGQLNMEVNGAALSGQSWNGSNQRTVSSSPYHEIDIGGGSFQLIGDRITGTSDHLQSDGAIGLFQPGGSKSALTIDARRGFLFSLTDATLNTNLSGGSWTAHLQPDRDHPAYICCLGDLKPWQDAVGTGWQQSNQRIATIEHFNISNASFGLLTSAPPQFNVSSAGSLTTVPEFTHADWSATKLNMSTGTWALSTTYAVEQAIEQGRQVVLQTDDDDHHQYMVFGPEGISTVTPANQRFVVFMSSDPKPLTDRIRAMVNSQQTQQAISAAVFGPLMNQQTKNVANASKSLDTAKKFADDLESALGNQNTSNDSVTVFQSFLKSWSANAGDGQ